MVFSTVLNQSLSLYIFFFFCRGGRGYIWKQKSKSKFKTYFRSRQDFNHFLLLEQWVLQTPKKAVKTPAAFASASCFQKDVENIPSCLFSSELYVSYISQVEATQPTSCVREYNENHHNDLWSFYVFWGRLNIIRGRSNSVPQTCLSPLQAPAAQWFVIRSVYKTFETKKNLRDSSFCIHQMWFRNLNLSGVCGKEVLSYLELIRVMKGRVTKPN